MYGQCLPRGLVRALKVGSLLSVACAGASAPAFAGCSGSDYAGSICSTAASFCPTGFVELNGQSLKISDNNLLFAVIGCAYTPDGVCQVEFSVPDMRGRVAVGAGHGPGLSNFERGEKRGAETATLTVSQLPPHTHQASFMPSGGSVTVSAYDGNGVSPSPSNINNRLQTVAQNAFAPATDANLYGPGSGFGVNLGGVEANFSGVVAVDPAGGGQPFSIQNPVTAVTYCMSNIQLFPPRP